MAAPIRLTPQLRADYERLYASADIRPERRAERAALARRLADPAHWPRYAAVAASLGAPPHLPALIHALEAGLDFSRHLHNGDPLTARTVHVPQGRPATGEPPFTWEQSAIDALRLHGVDAWSDWSVPGLCYVLEGYNGWGYRLYHPEVPSPYLWSGTSVYTAGKYVADGSWSATAVSRQCGALALLRGLADRGLPLPEEAASVVPPDATPLPAFHVPLGPGSTGPEVAAVQSRLLERGYRELGGVDRIYGAKTAQAVRRFQAGSRDASGRPLAVDGAVGPATWQALFGPAPGRTAPQAETGRLRSRDRDLAAATPRCPGAIRPGSPG